MENKVKSIAILTSGGDAPGMNAAIRAVVRTALARGVKVYGVMRGYNGLIDGDIYEMNLRSVSDIIHRGGTILYTARSPLFRTEEGLNKAVETCKKLDIGGVAVLGGDGSFKGAGELTAAGVNCVGIPCTIDNDISATEYTIGFDTAMNTAVEMVDKLRDTTQSHDRCSVVEVMGRKAGYLALNTGIGVGATSVIVPEIPYDFEKDIISKIRATQKAGKKHFIIVVAEGVGHVHELAERIEKETGIESRATVLGHVQRGGSPSVRDREMASRMGYHAANLLCDGIGNRIVSIRNSEVVDDDIQVALAMKKEFDFDGYKMADIISI